MSPRARKRLAVATLLSPLALTALPTAPAHAAPLATLPVACPDLGTATLRVAGPLLVTGSLRPSAGDPITVRRVGLDVRDAAGHHLSVAATGSGVRCTTSVKDVAWGQLADAAALKQAGVPANGTASGSVTVVVDANTEAVVAAATRASAKTGPQVSGAALASDPAGYGPVTALPYSAQMSATLSGRPGSVALAWRAAGSSTIYRWTRGESRNVTASIVKVQVMATVMYQAQSAGRGLTAWEKSQLVPMIRYSDNNATTNLWEHIGRGGAVAPVIGRMGLRETTPGPGGFWGLTVTSAPDQVVLVDHFARHNPVLNDSMRAYGLSLMRSVSSAQDWGVTAGPGADIAVKNGWLPRADGWHVNSVGFNHKAPRPYSAAVLTHSTSAGMDTMVATIERASRLMWSRDRVARGDSTGDGRADLLGIKGGTLYRFRNNGGQLAAPTAIGAGWGSYTWIGSTGDVNRDGRPDLLARDGSGQLVLFTGTGSGFVRSRVLGTGWGSMALATTDMDGDGAPEVIARTSNGQLRRYALPATGTARLVGTVGSGWGGYRTLLGVSGIRSDVRGDLLGVTTASRLQAFAGTGGSFTALGQMGTGFGTLVATPGDINGDMVDDVVAQTGAGLRTYPVTASGNLAGSTANSGSAAGFRLLG